MLMFCEIAIVLTFLLHVTSLLNVVNLSLCLSVCLSVCLLQMV